MPITPLCDEEPLAQKGLVQLNFRQQPARATNGQQAGRCDSQIASRGQVFSSKAAPALLGFDGALFLAYVATDDSNQLQFTSSVDEASPGRPTCRCP
jgi:hypothetical protein